MTAPYVDPTPSPTPADPASHAPLPVHSPPEAGPAAPTPARHCAPKPPRCRAARSSRHKPHKALTPSAAPDLVAGADPPTQRASPPTPSAAELVDDDEPQDFDPTDDRWERLEAALADAFSDDGEQEHLWDDACRGIVPNEHDMPDDP